MDENKIKELWQFSNELEKSFLLNKKNAEDVTKMKVHSLLSMMKPLKNVAILAGIIWVCLGSIAIIYLCVNSFVGVSSFFLYSVSIQLLLTAVALVLYLYQLILIHKVDVSEPILATQEKLVNLKSSTLWSVRILFLQLPLWTTFYWNDSIFQNWSFFQWVIQGIITACFAFISFWLFFNIQYKNKDKKWFKLIFSGNEWTPLIKSMELIEEIKQFKQDRL